MPRVEDEIIIEIPFGNTRTVSVYINDILYDSIFNFNVSKRLDNVWIFDALVPGSNKSDTNLLRGNTVKVFVNNNIFLKGIIESSKYHTAQMVNIRGIGAVSYKLREKKVTQDEENKSYYNAKTSAYIVDSLCSTNLDGSSPWIVTTNHVNTYPSIYVRMDNENRLNGIMGTAKACDYNWYESWGSFPYDDHIMNIAEHKGSDSSVHTFEISGDSQNTINSEREENREELYNDITVLGYGDGVNQLKTKTFHATTNRSYLTADMTASGTETINVADTTDLPSSGNVWIGCEKVTYTGKTATTLTGITRGAAFMDDTNVVESYIHTEYIAVYDAQYTTTSAQTDSSIGDGTETNDANWGINEQNFTDKTIIDQDTLDKIAQYLLDTHKDIIVKIILNPMEMYDTVDAIEVGDVVTINDADLGSVGDTYRIIGIDIGRDHAVPYIKVECSSAYTNITDILVRMEKESKSMSSYMQGAPNVISVQSYENAQYSATPEDKAMKMKFRIWDKTIAIQDARLDMKILPFRGYVNASQTSAGGSESAKTSSSGDTAEYMNQTFTSYNTGSTYDSSSSDEYISASVPPMASGMFDGCVVTVTIENQTGSSDNYDFDILNVTQATTLDSESSVTIADGGGKTYNYNYSTSEVAINDVIKLNIDDGIVGTNAAKGREGSINLHVQSKSTHTHTINLSTHTHAITMAHGIFEDTDTPTVKVQIGDDDDWAATKGYINSGSAYSYGTHNNIDISTELKDLLGDLSSTKRIRIQFEPQGSANTCRIEANADVFVFMGST